MLRDLQDATSTPTQAKADVVVVGGGIAGLLVATRLARAGVRTIVLESGGAGDGARTHPLNAVVQVGQPYQGAEGGRFRGLGGTSVRWGGAMLPFQDCDMGEHTAGWPVDWPVSIDELRGGFDELETLFRLPAGAFDLEGDIAGEGPQAQFLLRSAKWPQFRLRNVAHVLRREISAPNLQVWLNATVSDFKMGADGKLAAVRARAPSGAEITVEARFVVIAAGAIESTRLMLLLDAQHDNRIFRPHQLLGRYFFDHMSAPAATLEPPINRRALNETFGIRFERSGMRDVRMEPGPALRVSDKLPASFAHVTATSPLESGFDALRAIYRDLQSGSTLNWTNVLGVSKDLGWFAEAAWWRLVKRRLLAPRHARYQIVMVTEQFPNPASTIALSEDRRDVYGSPLAKIDWQTDDRDVEAFRRLQLALETFWMNSKFRHLAQLKPVPEDVWSSQLQSGSDIFHPGGTTRMARDASAGVVDGQLRSFQVENLFVVSTSAFPSGGGANPTFTLMALALRAADRIAREVAS